MSGLDLIKTIKKVMVKVFVGAKDGVPEKEEGERMKLRLQ